MPQMRKVVSGPVQKMYFLIKYFGFCDFALVTFDNSLFIFVYDDISATT